MKFRKVLIFILAVIMLLVTVSCKTDSETGAPETTASQGTSEPSEEEKTVSTYENPAIAKAAYQAETIIKISEPNYPVSLTLSTLQGLAANKGTTQILISTGGAQSKYLSYIKEDYGVNVVTKDDNEKTWTTWTLLESFKDKLSGYILCDNDKTSESVNIAISLCNQLNAVAVTKNQENKAQDAGLSCVLDVTGKDSSWWTGEGSEYYEKLSKTYAVEQDPDLMPLLSDYAAMTGAFYNFYNGKSKKAHQDLFSMLSPGGIIFGYNNKHGEYDTVLSLSEKNISMIPSDHARNLSTLSGFKLESVKQKTEEISAEPPAENKHTVCFVMSDGDNVQWLLNNFINVEWYGSKNRGDFSLGWGLPTTAIDLAAPMMKYCYDNMTAKDNFIVQLSGLGYTFPSKWTDEAAKEKMAQNVNDYMKRSDISVLEILDDYDQKVENFDKASNFDVFTKQDQIKGILYIDYSGNYNVLKGATVWSNNKPVVSAKYSLWATGNEKNTPAGIASGIKAASKDPKEIDAYSFVIVHAWSGLSGNNLKANGDTMKAIKKTVDLLSEDADIDVVTPDEFINRITKNVTH